MSILKVSNFQKHLLLLCVETQEQFYKQLKIRSFTDSAEIQLKKWLQALNTRKSIY